MTLSTIMRMTRSIMPIASSDAGAPESGSASTHRFSNASSSDISHPSANKLHTDIIRIIFYDCLSGSDITGILALSCMNIHWYINIHKHSDAINIEKLCPGLTIQDARRQGFKVYDEPRINKLKVFKYFSKFAAYVENNAGLTVLTVPKNFTSKQVVALAKEAGIEIKVWSEKIWGRLGNDSVKKTYRVMISNDLILKTRNKNYFDQNIRVVDEIGFDLIPKIKEYLLLLICTQKISKLDTCLYQNLTYGRSSTHIGGIPLLVGGSAPAKINVIRFNFALETDGAGGRKKL